MYTTHALPSASWGVLCASVRRRVAVGDGKTQHWHAVTYDTYMPKAWNGWAVQYAQYVQYRYVYESYTHLCCEAWWLCSLRLPSPYVYHNQLRF